jgi:hypothetical protein
MLPGPALVEGGQGATAGRIEPQQLLAQVSADFKSICLQDSATENDIYCCMDGVVARDEHGDTMPCLFRSHRAPRRKAPSRGLSRSTSVVNLNPMTSILPLRTLASASLVESRWNSSRALKDCGVAREGNGDTMPSLFKSHRASNRKSSSGRLSQSTSVADFNPVASTLPLRSLPSVTLADSRWSSSRALNDCPPKLPTEEENSDDRSRNVGDLAPRSRRKTCQAKARSKVSLQPAVTGAEKALPPKTVCRASLADTRWNSSRSLSDNAPKTPKSPHRKKQKDSHIRSPTLGLMRDAPDNESPALPADKIPSPSRHTRQSTRTSPLAFGSPTSVATVPSDHDRKAMSRRSESSGTGEEGEEPRLHLQSAFRDEDSIGSLELEERRALAQ